MTQAQVRRHSRSPRVDLDNVERPPRWSTSSSCLKGPQLGNLEGGPTKRLDSTVESENDA